MMRLLSLKFGLIACVLAVASAFAQSTRVRSASDAPAVLSNAPASPNLLRDLNRSLEGVVSKVSPAVVQIVVAGYGPSEDHGHTNTARIVRQHAIGTGIIVDSDGYIMTNAHVVEGAQRIRVALPMSSSASPANTPAGKRQVFDAKLVGIHKESDLALLKIDQTDLPTLSLEGTQNLRVG